MQGRCNQPNLRSDYFSTDIGTILDTAEDKQPYIGQLVSHGRNHPLYSYKVNYMKQLSDKFGEDRQASGRLMSEDPAPLESDNEFSLSNDDSNAQVSCLKGERVDPHLRIHQVDKLLVKCEYLTTQQRRLLVSRRNTAKLRLRQKNKRDYSILIRVELDVIQEAVSIITCSELPSCKMSYFCPNNTANSNIIIYCDSCDRKILQSSLKRSSQSSKNDRQASPPSLTAGKWPRKT